MEAVAVVPELHETVSGLVVPSLYRPLAVKSAVPPTGILGVSGEIWIDCSVAAVTVSTVDPETDPSVAEMVLVPMATAVASPPVEMVAVVVVSEAQVTWLVKFFVVVSL